MRPRHLPLVLLTVVAIGTAAFAARPPSGPVPAAPVATAVADAAGTTSAIVTIGFDADLTAVIDLAGSLGLGVRTVWPRLAAFVADGPSAAFLTLATDPRVALIEHNTVMTLYTDTSHDATRGDDVVVGKVVRLADGTPIDGTGIGIAVVDTGVDGTHPDLRDRMGGNIRHYGVATVRVADSDTLGAGGHGTHVAGTAVGDGTASEFRYHGAAPGATLFGVGAGTVILLENGLNGLNWVLENHDQVSPRIRVVNNSWGNGHSEYDPDSSVHRAAEALVREGVVVVWAAGNDGGDGSEATTSAQCVNPTPGIICVANYDDQDRGTRDKGSIDRSSSRGRDGALETYPDVAAPGTNITSTCRLTLVVCSAHFDVESDPPNAYSTLSGTSMAAPHVAGIVALLLQADPTLRPAEVEYLLEATATRIGTSTYTPDRFHPARHATSHDAGHGLVDVVAALQAVLSR